MLSFNPKDEKHGKVHAYMLSAIAPRPIAFVSSIDKEGRPNLSPFSFFNAFGSNPATLVFSPARRGRDNTVKHTFENVKEVAEVVVNVVNYAMVQQMSLASTEYPKGVSEFEKAGFTPIASDLVKPFRVKESPVQMECIVKNIIETGTEGGAGNLVICEIVRMHIVDEVLDTDGHIDANKIDLVARMGGNWYCRASGDALFEIEKPLLKHGIGVDALPPAVRLSPVLSGNDLGVLGNLEGAPKNEEIAEFRKSPGFQENQGDQKMHLFIKHLISQGRYREALIAAFSA